MNFIIICLDNRYRCPYLGESRTTTVARSTPITRAGGRLPCRPTNSCGYQQGESSSYLISLVLFEEPNFRTTGYLTANEQGPGPRWYPPVLPSRYNPFAGTIGSPDSLPVRTLVGSGSYQQVKPGGITLDGTLEGGRQRHQQNELKMNILVSP